MKRTNMFAKAPALQNLVRTASLLAVIGTSNAATIFTVADLPGLSGTFAMDLSRDNVESDVQAVYNTDAAEQAAFNGPTTVTITLGQYVPAGPGFLRLYEIDNVDAPTPFDSLNKTGVFWDAVPVQTSANAWEVTIIDADGINSDYMAQLRDGSAFADGISFAAAVPEPTTALLALMGALGLLRRRR